MRIPPDYPKKVALHLGRLYPSPESELNFSNEYELLVCVILSAQCTDKKVNEVTPVLFSKYPDLPSLAAARITSVEKIIRPINYYRTKAKNIVGMAKDVRANHSGKVPRTHDELILLPGVGRKTANVVLGEMKVAHTLPVDTHVFRVARRLGLTDGKKPEEVEEDLKKLYPSHLWRNLHHWLILHGRRICKAQKPLCDKCRLSEICPSSNK